MVSEVDICNRAILEVHGSPITSLSDNSEEGVSCSILYPQLRDEVLRAHFWNFAITQKTLQLDVTAPLFGFQRRYLLPEDYIRIRRLKFDRHSYKVQGNYLHTDSSGVDIEYVKREENTTLFDPLFVSALVLRLASSLAYPIAGSAERAGQLLTQYTSFMKEAKRRDGQEGTPDDLTADLFVDSRRGDSGNYPSDWTNS
jgi:hypothetical protein